ncbi:MAG TPA: hypothetical protein VFI86_08125 [Burkholderiales bacterium]|nr:hypothetical protein [Burkholderiales bacterium]
MNSALVSRIVSSIPERTARSLTGTAFDLDGARACSDPARLAGMVRLLQWLSPLTPLSQDEQRALGVNGSGRPGTLADDEPDEPGHDAPPPIAERMF